MSAVIASAHYFLVALVVSASGSLIRSVTCPCGTSGKNYTFPVDGLAVKENPCDRLSQCETCQEGIPYCVTCPLDRSGGFCDTDLERNLSRKKRSDCSKRKKRSTNNSSDRRRIPDDISCVAQEIIYNGKVFRSFNNEYSELVTEDSEMMSVPVGTRLWYECDSGYILKGKVTSECLPNGFWSADAPSCVRGMPPESDVKCVALDPIPNGIVYRIFGPDIDMITDDSDEMEFPADTLVQFNCTIGYILRGHRDLFCTRDGLWSHDTPECVMDCGKSVIEPTPKLTNANRTEEGEWPWMVAISPYRGSSDNDVISCGGTLLGQRTVLTAAHCFDITKPRYVLLFGKYYRSGNRNGVERRVVLTDRQIIIHPQYNNVTYANDIALVKLDSKLQFTERILPICLPTPESTPINVVTEKFGTVTGWGMDENELMATSLMAVDLPVQSSQTCTMYFQRELNMRDDQVSPDVFCAGYQEGDINACRGDSGSPMVFYDWKTHKYTIEGCVSHALRGQCDCEGRYTVFTKISSYIDWIYNPR